MKQGRTLAEVMQQVEKEAKAKRDLIVPAQSLFMGDEADYIAMETTAVPVGSANTTVMQKDEAAAGQPHPKIEVELSPHDDFILDIAVGKNRNQKNWKPYKITFKQLKERLAKTVYTDETMAQYATFSRTKQGKICRSAFTTRS